MCRGLEYRLLPMVTASLRGRLLPGFRSSRLAAGDGRVESSRMTEVGVSPRAEELFEDPFVHGSSRT
mgnify:CR=1 FL=1